MKNKKKILALVLAIVLVLASGAASAATPVSVPIVSSGAVDGAAGNTITYDPAKNDTTNRYNFAYKATMDMSQVWSNWNMFKTMYLLKGNTEEQWRGKILDAEFVMSAHVDLTYAEFDPTVLTDKNAVLATFKASNAGIADGFLDLCTCTYATWTLDGDGKGGTWLATIAVSGLSIATLEDNPLTKPNSITFITPDGSLAVPQSKFAGGQSFKATNLTFSGYITMRYMYTIVPITFNETPADIEMTMTGGPSNTFEIVDNYGAADGTLVVFRTGATGETAGAYIKNTTTMNADGTYASNGAYPSAYDLDIRLNGTRLTAEQIAKLTWTVEGAGGYPTAYGANVVSVADGSKVVTGLKSGVAKLTATLNGATASIYVVIPGDVSRNGNLNNADAASINAYVGAGNDLSRLGVNDQFTLLLADMNGNGNVNNADAAIINSMFAGAISPKN